MSEVNITLATNRLQIDRTSGPVLLNSVTYINITSVNGLVEVDKQQVGQVPGLDGTAPAVDTLFTRYIVELHMADGRTERINLDEVVNQVGWTNDQAGYEQAEDDIYAAFPAGGGGGGGLTGITGIAGISYAGTPVSVMTVSDGPDAREALGATTFHGPYAAGLVVNFRDLVMYDDQWYEWLGGQTTTVDFVADLNWSAVTSAKQSRIRSIRVLVDTDSLNIDAGDDTVWQSLGTGDYTENVNAQIGTTLTFKCDASATQLTFNPGVSVDGVTPIVLTAGAWMTVQAVDGAGKWIQIG